MRTRVLAEEHPDRLVLQNDIANAYQADGQVKKAVELLGGYYQRCSSLSTLNLYRPYVRRTRLAADCSSGLISSIFIAFIAGVILAVKSADIACILGGMYFIQCPALSISFNIASIPPDNSPAVTTLPP